MLQQSAWRTCRILLFSFLTLCTLPSENKKWILPNLVKISPRGCPHGPWSYRWTEGSFPAFPLAQGPCFLTLNWTGPSVARFWPTERWTHSSRGIPYWLKSPGTLAQIFGRPYLYPMMAFAGETPSWVWMWEQTRWGLFTPLWDSKSF